MTMTRDFRAYTPADDEAEYLRESVDILPEAIKEEFVRIPADLAYWGERYAEAVKAYLLAENHMKTTKAMLRLQFREDAKGRGEKLTEGDVDARVEQSAQYQDAKLAEIEAEANKMAAKVRLDAVAAKREMIVSLGAHIRQEFNPTQLNRSKSDY